MKRKKSPHIWWLKKDSLRQKCRGSFHKSWHQWKLLPRFMKWCINSILNAKISFICVLRQEFIHKVIPAFLFSSTSVCICSQTASPMQTWFLQNWQHFLKQPMNYAPLQLAAILVILHIFILSLLTGDVFHATLLNLIMCTFGCKKSSI